MPGAVGDSESSFRARLVGAFRIVDIVVLLSVPAALVGVFLAPLETRQSLAFPYSDPTILTAFTAAYIHLEAVHLATNVGGYLLVVPLALLLSALSGHRQRFYTAFFTFLVAFPFVLSYLNLAVARAGVGVGFSGVLLAFVGFLPIALASYLSTHFEIERPLNLASVLFFFWLALVAVLSVRSPITYGLAAASILAAVLYIPSVPANVWVKRVQRASHVGGYFELATITLCLFLLLPLVAFPADPSGEGVVTNIYIHLLGYALGFIVTYVTVHVDRRISAATAAPG